MKRLLLTGLLSAAILGVSAATPLSQFEKQSAAATLKPTIVKNSAKASEVRYLAPGVSISTTNGMKRLHALKSPATIKKPSRVVAKAPLPDGMVFFESFEDWPTDDLYWIPDGWELDHRGQCEPQDSWTPCGIMPMMPLPADGDCMFGINYSMNSQDEWLITPEISIGDNFQLTFWCYLEPFFLYSLDNFDWDLWDFVGDKEVAATLQIWAQPAGEDWTLVHDFADDYRDMTGDELFDAAPTGLEKKSISLAGFAGKDIKIAFRLVGCDGNTMFLDAVGVGYPSLDDVSYMEPLETLYFGFEPTWELSYMMADIAQYGVYTPITWTNLSYNEGATYSWTYTDPETIDTGTASGEDMQDELTLSYAPDYSSETSLRNNLCYPPVLTASAPNAMSTEYSVPYPYFQAGGTCEFVFNDQSTFKGCYLPFGINTSGLAAVSVADDEIGDPSIPVFGYSSNVDRYWLDYSLNGAEAESTDYSHLLAIANLFCPSEYAVVVNGMTLAAYGQVDDDAEFTATILALNSDWERDLSTMTTIATAKISGSALSRQYADSKGFMVLDFTFDEPVALAATDEHPAYFFMIEGFRSDKVEYFQPLQSHEPLPNYLCWGYTLFQIDLSAQTGRPAYYNIKPMQYKENGEYADLYGAFAIGVKADYPWLTTDCEKVEISDEPVEVALGSYYDGSKLAVEAPAGLTATVAGRYNNCVLTVAKTSPEVETTGNITVKGPGVELTIPVKAEAAGLQDAIAAGKTAIAVYDLNGRAINPADAAAGVYVVKYDDGSAEKHVIK